MAIHLEFLGSLLADLVNRYGITAAEGLFKEGTKTASKALEEEARKGFEALIFSIPEPWRTRMNEHYRRARAEFIENLMARMVVKAMVSFDTDEKRGQYLIYLAMLNWDTPVRNAITGEVLPSFKEELDKIHHDPIPEFFEWGLEKLNKVAKESTPKVEQRVERIRAPLKALSKRIQERTEKLQKGGTKPWIF